MRWPGPTNALAAGALAAAVLGVIGSPAGAQPVELATAKWRPAYAIDGDTIRVRGKTVRLLGYDSPEMGQHCYWQATRKMARLIRNGVRLRNVSGKDHYGRTLAYVRTRDGRDVGTVMLRAGLAVARYDSLDGYAWHPLQNRYRRIDARNGPIRC